MGKLTRYRAKRDFSATSGKTAEARRCLRRAVDIDPDSADALYNLARLEFDADNLAEAKRLWQAYLGFDATSEWAQTARRGIRYADLRAMQRSTG